MTIIKICGITNEFDRDMCLNEGADLVGFNIYEGSKRYINRKTLKKLLVPDISSQSVLVGVNMEYDEWADMIDFCRPGYVQLHGNEDVSIIKQIKKRFPGVLVIKKVDIGYRARFEFFLESADYILCDAETDEYGGSGKKFNWEYLLGVNKETRAMLFAAGGVNPGNINNLLKYELFGVDVASGSEVLPGRKDFNKVKDLIEKVKKHEK